MNLRRRNVKLGIVCAVLSVATFLQLRSEADAFVDVGDIPLLFDGFTSDNVGTVWLLQPKIDEPGEPAAVAADAAVAYDQLVMSRREGQWRIAQVPNQAATDLTGAPVMKSRIENDVFRHLRQIRSDAQALVQPDASEEQLRRFGLDGEHALVVRCVDANGTNIVAELLVGNAADAGRSGSEAVRGVFVRPRGSNDVTLYELEQPWRLDVEAENWIDRVLLRIEPEKVRYLAIRNASTDGREFAFERAPNRASWQRVAPTDDELGALRQSEVEALVQRLRYVAAQRFVRPASRAGDLTALGLGPPQIRVTLRLDGADAREITLEIGNRVDGRAEYYLMCSETPFLVTWPASNVTQLERDVERRLFDPKPK